MKYWAHSWSRFSGLYIGVAPKCTLHLRIRPRYTLSEVYDRSIRTRYIVLDTWSVSLYLRYPVQYSSTCEPNPFTSVYTSWYSICSMCLSRSSMYNLSSVHSTTIVTFTQLTIVNELDDDSLKYVTVRRTRTRINVCRRPDQLFLTMSTRRLT